LVGFELDINQLQNVKKLCGIMDTHNKGVPLSREDRQRVDLQLLMIYTIGLNDIHSVVINGEKEVGITGNVDETHPIPLPFFNADNGQCGCIPTVEATQAVDQSRVRGTN
jgi:hypothetical protein